MIRKYIKNNDINPQNVNVIHKEKLTKVEKLALWITEHVGSMKFFLIILCWTVLWLSWNTIAPIKLRFDPYPAFVLWLFISNMIQIFLMPLIMIGQNLQSRHAELRAEADYDVDVKSKIEIEKIVAHLEYQNDVLNEIMYKINKTEKN